MREAGLHTASFSINCNYDPQKTPPLRTTKGYGGLSALTVRLTYLAGLHRHNHDRQRRYGGCVAAPFGRVPTHYGENRDNERIIDYETALALYRDLCSCSGLPASGAAGAVLGRIITYIIRAG